MRIVSVWVAFALLMDFPATASIGQPDGPQHKGKQQALISDKRAGAAEASGEYPVIPDCTVTVVPVPLPQRPALQRATFASPLPVRKHRVHRRRKTAHLRHPHHVRHYHHHVTHKAVHHRSPVRHHRLRRHARPHRPTHPQRPIVHRLTYAVPLCGHPDQSISDMLGLPRVTQPSVVADKTSADTLPVFIDLPPFFGGWPGPTGPTGPGPIVPIWPVGPGPIILVPPGPPVVTNPVTPPPPAVPEPSSWALIILGMMLVGGGMRRRSAATKLQ